MDDEGRIMNFFVRDSRSKLDYECFGDVMIVDTTFKTNRYNLICAPFVGVNHHRNNVMYGIAFMSDEITSSFEWLFAIFLEAMEGKEPQVIFSDQCQALMNGIDYCFRTVAHRLCQWHVNQNAPSHFGSLNGAREFKRMWSYCMNGCETKEEFEGTWATMIQKYDIGERSWFSNMYNLLKRWASVYTNDRFSAGMHATSQSVSVNKVLKSLCKCTSSLHEVITQYESIQKEWRVHERAEDACCLGIPDQFLDNNPLLKHAAGLYTRTVYRIFKTEVAHLMNVNILQQPHKYAADELVFQVSCNSATPRIRVVKYIQFLQNVSSTCRKWEIDGILCRHILKIFYTLNMPRLPEHYILKRWRKSARNRIQNHIVTPTGGDMGQDILFLNDMMRLCHAIAQECKDTAALRSIMNERMRLLYNEICGASNGDERGETRDEGTCPRDQGGIGVRDPCTRPNRQWVRKKRASRVNRGRLR